MTITIVPIDIAEIKDDLGITGTEDDAWLQRRITAILARFREYTQAVLYPAQTFKDDYTTKQERLPFVHPPYYPTSTLYLRWFPVLEVVSIKVNGSDGDVTKLKLDEKVGKLLTYEQGDPTRLDPVVEYVAGYASIPPDLNEAMMGVLGKMWSQRNAEKKGLAVGGMVPSSINVEDVGSIRLGGASASGFDVNLSGNVHTFDPLLGPYTYILDSYCDKRSAIGLGEGSVSRQMTNTSPFPPPVTP